MIQLDILELLARPVPQPTPSQMGRALVAHRIARQREPIRAVARQIRAETHQPEHPALAPRFNGGRA